MPLLSATFRPWALMLPMLVVVLGVVSWPLLQTIFLSLSDAGLVASSGSFVGVDNYLNNLDKHIENQQKQLFNMGERKKGIQKELGNDENYADVIAE